jgi:hypothetical protein
VISGTLKMGTGSVPETLEEFYTLMQLVAQEDFIEFCCCESFKIYIFFFLSFLSPSLSGAGRGVHMLYSHKY